MHERASSNKEGLLTLAVPSPGLPWIPCVLQAVSGAATGRSAPSDGVPMRSETAGLPPRHRQRLPDSRETTEPPEQSDPSAANWRHGLSACPHAPRARRPHWLFDDETSCLPDKHAARPSGGAAKQAVQPPEPASRPAQTTRHRRSPGPPGHSHAGRPARPVTPTQVARPAQPQPQPRGSFDCPNLPPPSRLTSSQAVCPIPEPPVHQSASSGHAARPGTQSASPAHTPSVPSTPPVRVRRPPWVVKQTVGCPPTALEPMAARSAPTQLSTRTPPAPVAKPPVRHPSRAPKPVPQIPRTPLARNPCRRFRAHTTSPGAHAVIRHAATATPGPPRHANPAGTRQSTPSSASRRLGGVGR